MVKSRSSLSVAVAVLGCGLIFGGFSPAAGASGKAAPELSLEEVLARFDEVQQSIRTLSAEFDETTHNQLLKAPAHASGRLYMTKPNAVMWEYTAPETMQFVIARDEYVGYFPGRKQAERRNIKRWSEQIFRFFAVGQPSGELRRFYDIHLASDPRRPDTYVLVLEPIKRRIRKRVESVRVWVDASTFLPTQVAYEDQSGNRREIRFRNIRVNPDLSASLYEIRLPKDVTVTTGFSGLGAVPTR